MDPGVQKRLRERGKSRISEFIVLNEAKRQSQFCLLFSRFRSCVPTVLRNGETVVRAPSAATQGRDDHGSELDRSFAVPNLVLLRSPFVALSRRSPSD